MKPLEQPADLRAYYQDAGVVDDYLRRRTSQPLNGVLHAGQVRFLNRIIRERRPRAVLEIAPGPARLTAELLEVPFGLGADFSAGMLELARQRMRAAGRRWDFVRADAFHLPLAGATVDLAFSLKFVRHFKAEDRRRIYAEIRRILRPGGALVLDAQNRAVRAPDHVSKQAIYDELYSEASLRQELEAAGFRVHVLEGMIKHHATQRALNRLRGVGPQALLRALIRALELVPGENPSMWMVLGERI
jgi:ubiquinone/menaquinone biosynthesis C-methylase UbiE